MCGETCGMSVSVVIPLFNEVENIAPLYAALTDVLPGLGREYEIILVDDGSQDGTNAALRELAEAGSQAKIGYFRGKCRHTDASSEGIRYCTWEVIISRSGY